MNALPRFNDPNVIDLTGTFTDEALRLHDTAGSFEIAHFQGTRRLTPQELQAADIEASRWQERHPVSPRRATPRRRSRIRPRHVFAVIFTVAVVLIAYHMSDAYARSLADIRQIAAGNITTK